MSRIACDNKNIKVFRFGANIGYQSSILFGLQQCRGEYAVQLDCDLQDPPELIDGMLKTMLDQNLDMIYGVRVTRNEFWMLTKLRQLFYRSINILSRSSIPVDAGDFRILNRKALDVLRRVHLRRPYLRGLLHEMGFSSQGIEYHRETRYSGATKFRFSSLLSLAVDALINHSDVPLKLATWFGCFVFLLSISMGFYYLAIYFREGDWPPGVATTVMLELANLGIQALLLGVIGEYIARIYKEVIKLPGPIVSCSINDEGSDSEESK